MSNHGWAKKGLSALSVVTVVGGIWYSAAHHHDPTKLDKPVAFAGQKTLKTAIAPAVNIDAAATIPTIKTFSGQVHLSVNTSKVARVQKVEFYVENKLIGAAYTTPYSVIIDENSLQPGSHQVTAKIYTPETTSVTPPANFTSQESGSLPVTTGTLNTPLVPTPIPSTTTPVDPVLPPVAVAPGNPTNVVALEQSNNSVIVSWTGPSDGSPAVGYQVWRDSTSLGTITGTSYTDSTALVGSSYMYSIIAIDVDNNTSEPSKSGQITITQMSPPTNQTPSSAQPQNTTPVASPPSQ
jgi:hypothetical protein